MEKPANVTFGYNISTPSLPKLSKKPATPLFDRQPEKRRRTFPSPVSEETCDNRQLISETTSAIVPAVFDCTPAMCVKHWPSPISAPLL